MACERCLGLVWLLVNLVEMLLHSLVPLMWGSQGPPPHPPAVPADLALPRDPHGCGAGACVRAADLSELEAVVAPVPGRLEGAAGGDVLHASQVREVEPADPGHHPRASGADLPCGRNVGAHLVAFLELTKPRITQLVLLTAAAGFYLGPETTLAPWLLLTPMLGTARVPE